MGERETRALLAGGQNLPMNDILLTGLLLAIERQYGMGHMQIDMEGHGREPMGMGEDISRTIGWFTSLYPVWFEKKGSSLEEAVKQVKETLRRVPNKGLDHLLYRYGAGEENVAPVIVPWEPSSICFNYLGQTDADLAGRGYQLWQGTQGDPQSEEEIQSYDWEVSGLIRKGRLEITLMYSGLQYDRQTVQRLMALYRGYLQELAEFITNGGKVGLIPADTGCSFLTMEQLLELEGRYKVVDVYPLSPMQEGLLFHSVLDGSGGNYIAQTSCRLRGSLDMGLVRKSLSALVRRHDILRTVFLHEGYDRHIQVVQAEGEVDCRELDLRGDHGGVGLAELRERERLGSFDLSRDVLMRLLVVRLGEEEYELIWSHHHVLLDGWCMGLLVREFWEAYRMKGEVLGLEEVRPYGEYIRWLEGREKSSSEDYWRRYLAMYDSVAGLPRREKVLPGGYEAGSVRVRLSEAETGRLRGLSVRYGVTLNTVFQCGWGLLLSKYNDTRDVVFGEVVSGRPVEIEGVERMVGLFINTVPVRIRYEGEEELGELLRRVQAAAMESEPHHYHSLAEIQALSELGSGLLDHVVTFENLPEELRTVETGVGAIGIEGMEYFVQTNYGYNITVTPGAELEIRMDYDGRVYEGGLMEEAGRYLRNILGWMGKGSEEELRVRELSVRSAEEEEELRREWSCDLSAGLEEVTIQERLRRSFAGHGSRLALEYEGGGCSYAELGERVRWIGGLLEEAGAGKGTVVGIWCGDRSWLISGMLGVLGVRGVMVPLERGLPLSRVRSMVEQTGMKYVLTDGPEPEGSGWPEGLRWLRMTGREGEAPEGEPWGGAYELQDDVYIYFTSGSTGQPKGVVGRNRGLSHFVGWEIRTFGIDASFRISQLTNPGFDAILRDVFVPLCAGGTVCIPGGEVLTTAGGLKVWLEEERITLVHCVPSLFKLLLREGLEAEMFRGLRYILLAGEKILPYELEGWYRLFGSRIQLVNAYGPTETTMIKGHRIISMEDVRRGYIPVRAMEGAQFMVLDPYGKASPVGAAGEICIRTPYRTGGYVSEAEGRGGSFVENPYGRQPGDLLYRTGDLGRDHGQEGVEILGRKDHQVKIRGIRVEPDDIRENMLRYAGVRDAVVVVREDAEGEKHLCGYTVPEEGYTIEGLRGYLQEVLPGHMVPGYLMKLKALPLLANGKVDRKGLPEPGVRKEEGYTAPEGEVERRLVEIWSEVLKVDSHLISTTRSFFELGGHSLKVLSLIDRIKREYKIGMSLKDIFDKKSVRSLANYLTTVGRTDNPQKNNPEIIEIVI